MGIAGRILFSFLLFSFSQNLAYGQVGGDAIGTFPQLQSGVPGESPLRTLIDISNIYYHYLGRGVDPAGYKFYYSHFTRGNVTMEDIEQDVANSSEAKVVKLFRTHLLRLPSQRERLYWTRVVDYYGHDRVMRYYLRKSSVCKAKCM